MRMIMVSLVGGALLLTGCGADSAASESAAASSSAADSAPASGDLTDDQRTCLDAGEAIVEARIPPAETPPANGPEALTLDRRILDALDVLDGLYAMGPLADGVERVMHTMGETTALQGVQSGRTWTDRRADLTEAVTELQSACADVGVTDYLNP